MTDPGNVYINKIRRDVVQSEDKTRRFDSFELSMKASKEQSIQKELVGQISQEVRATTTIGDIEALRQAVADGTYTPDPFRIAEKMLFLVED